jgi:hypothetical protein
MTDDQRYERIIHPSWLDNDDETLSHNINIASKQAFGDCLRA